MDKKIQLLKAKVDQWKTYTMISITATFTSIIAYWSFKEITIARISFVTTAPGFFLIALISGIIYLRENSKLISELEK